MSRFNSSYRSTFSNNTRTSYHHHSHSRTRSSSQPCPLSYSITAYILQYKIISLSTHNHISSQTDYKTQLNTIVRITRPPIKYNILNYRPLDNTNSTILSKHNNTIHTLPEPNHNKNYNTTIESLYPHQPKYHLPTIITPIYKNLKKDKIKKLKK